MHLSQLSIEGYKGVGEKTIVPLHKGLNVIVGENASGKTTIIDAIRLLLREDEFSYSPVSEGDFYKAFTDKSEPANFFLIKGKFGGLSDDDKITFLPWYDLIEHADLSMKVENKEKYGRFKKQVWGGSSKSSVFEWELFDKINCIYLPPLRDAEAKLKEGKSSRLARLLKNLEATAIKDAKDKHSLHALEEKMKKFNTELSKDKSVQGMNDKIRQKLEEAVGQTFGQDTHISFSEVGFNRIAESLRLFFFPDVSGHNEKENYRSLDENSLGHNNLLYLATILAELINSGEEDERFKVLLVEEPEAHLHPQLQIRLLKYLEEIAESGDIQVIVTSHSPVLASSASIDNLIHISANQQGTINTVSLKETGIHLTVTKDKEGKDLAIPPSDKFLSRWLDTTKSTLLFAKGIILVEGIAEAFLVPTIATKILSSYNEGKADEEKLSLSLDKAGVSVINMNGIYFKHFMRLFCNFGNEDRDSSNIAIKCAGITDRDPEKEFDEKTKKKTIPARPIKSNHDNGKNPALKLETIINSSDYCRLYVGAYKTLEYDLAMEKNNIQIMAKILVDNWHNTDKVYKELEKLSKKDWTEESLENKGDAANQLLKRIEDSNMGKGYFAQLLSENIVDNDTLKIPEYIENAIVWACGGQSLSNRGLLLDALCFSNGEHGACDKCREHGNCRINEKTDEQLDYIFSSIEESIFLKACPGSGKTEVVAIKAAHEISNWDKNGGIAILSFTNNAADVITERVSDFTGLESVAHPHFIGTFDSWLHTYVAHPFLFHYSKYKGDKENDFDFSFKLIDPSSGAGFLNSFATKYQYNGTGKPFANQYYYETYEEKWVFSSGERTVDASRNNMALENWRVLELLTTKTEFWKAGFANYQDVELMCAELLEEQAKLCGLLVNRFPYVIIDEAQDLSAGQLNIVEKLKKRGCQIHFVGDIQQSIYKFKKVDPSFVEKFSDKNVMKKMQLTNNFRSNQSIVDFSNKIIPPIGTIKGNANIENADCRFVSFKKTEMAKLPKWFEEHLEKFDDIDIQKSAIITRGKSSISKMRPSANYGLKLPHEIAMAIKMWSDGHSENLPDAIHMTGKFIANKFFSEFSAMPTQFYRPEIISKTSNWRSFIAAILNEITAVDGIIDLDKKWSEWAKILKKSFPDIIQKKQSDLGYSKYSYSFSLSKLSFSSPKGQKNNKVIDTIGYVERTATEISIKTIHAVKGQTLDAVMVVSSPTKGNDGHWEKWLEDSTKEPARFAYVASSRPKQVLVWAVPEVDNVQKNKLIGLGMLETDWEDS